MTPEQTAAANAAAAAAAANVAGAMGGTGSSIPKCPSFAGETENEADVLQFIREIEVWQKKSQTNDERTAAYVSSAFTSMAKRWYWLEVALENTRVDKWSTLKEELIERFAIVKGAASGDLKIKKGESLSAFLMRVEEFLLMKYKGFTGEMRGQDTFKIIKNKEKINLFLKGIPPAISKEIIAAGDHVCKEEKDYATFNMRNLLAKALQYERADEFAGLSKRDEVKVKQEKNLNVNAVEFLSDDQIDNMSVDQVRAAYRNLSQAARGGGAARNPAQMSCFHCGQKGSHRASDCPKKDQPQTAAGKKAYEDFKAARKARKQGRGGGNTNPGQQQQQQPAAAAPNPPAPAPQPQAAAQAPQAAAGVNAISLTQSQLDELVAQSVSRMYLVSNERPQSTFNINSISLLNVLSVIGQQLNAYKIRRRERPTIKLNINSRNILYTVDSGADVSCLSEAVFDSIPNKSSIPSSDLPPSITLSAANGEKLSAKKIALIRITMNGQTKLMPHVIVSGLKSDALLGWDVCQCFGMAIDPVSNGLVPRNTIMCKPNGDTNDWECADVIVLQDSHIGARRIEKLKVCLVDVKNNVARNVKNFILTPTRDFEKFVDEGIYCSDEDGVIEIPFKNGNEFSCDLKKYEAIAKAEKLSSAEFSVNELIINNFENSEFKPSPMSAETKAFIDKNAVIEAPNEFKNDYMALLYKYHSCIAKHNFDIGHMPQFAHKIELKDNSVNPVHTKQFPIPFHLKPVLDKYIDNLLEANVIKESSSPWNSPIFLIRKKTDPSSYRTLLDLRAVNALTKSDRYVFKTFSEIWSEVSRNNSKVFSTVDLVQSYFHLPLTEDSQPLTCFTVPGRGRYCWTRAVQGLHGCPSSFGRAIEKVVAGISGLNSFMDDALGHCVDHPKMLELCDELLKRFCIFGLKIKLPKCTFGSDKATFLGVEFGKNGVRPSTNNADIIKKFPIPTTPKQVKSFLGMCQFWNRHIRNYDLIARDLRILITKESKWKQGELPEAARNAFFKLRSILSERPLLINPDFTKRFYVFVDAATGDDSNPAGLGAMLAQLDATGHYRPINFISRGLKGSEKNYSPFLAEKLAICWALDKWRFYLLGNPFTLFTDCKPCTKLAEKQSATFCRLQEQLLEFNFDMKYLQSKENSVADAISRSVVDAVAIEIDQSDLPGLQKLDEDIMKVKAFIESNGNQELPQELKKIAKRCVLKNDTIWIKDDRFNLPTPQLVFWPPRRIVKSLIHQYHCLELMGHRGATQTKLRLREKFFWPQFYEDVEKFVLSCSICQRAQPNNVRRQPLIPYDPPNGPGDRVSIDLFTNVPAANGKKMNIIAFIDDYSKYLEIAPIADKKAETIANAFFSTWICRHGTPCSIRTDFGKEFRNQIFDHLATRLNIERCRMTSLSPSSNGQIENANRILVRAFQKMEVFEPEAWPSRLDAIRMAYNVALHRAHGFTPFYIQHGRCPNLGAFDPSLDSAVAPDIPENVAEYVDQLVSRLTSARDTVNPRLSENAKKMKEQHDKNAAKEIVFEPKSFVLLNYPKISQKGKFIKANRNWIGPFRIEKRTGRQMYIISAPGRSTQEVHANRLRKFSFGEDEWLAAVNSTMEAAMEEEQEAFDEEEEEAWNDPKPIRQSKKKKNKKKPKRRPDSSDENDDEEEEIEPRPTTISVSSSDSEDDSQPEDDDDDYNDVHMQSMRSPHATRSRGAVRNHEWVMKRALERKDKRKRPDLDDTVAAGRESQRARFDESNIVDSSFGDVSGVEPLDNSVLEEIPESEEVSSDRLDTDAVEFKTFCIKLVNQLRARPSYADIVKRKRSWILKL